MDIINETTNTFSKTPSFFSYITTFEDEHKHDLMNIFQYALVIMIPVILLNKGIGEIFSSSTENKTTLEVSFELICELCLLLFGIYMAHRVASYIPTYSGTPYTPFSFIGFVLSFIVIIFNFDTNLRAKFDYVFQNVYDMIHGKILTDNAIVNNASVNNAIRANPVVNANTNTNINTNTKINPNPNQTNQAPEYVKQQAIQNMNQGNNQPVSTVSNTYNQSLNEKLYEFPQQFPDTSNIETFNPEPFSGF